MKLASFEYQNTATYGLFVGDRLVDLAKLMGDKAPDLRTLIAHDLLQEAAQQAQHADTIDVRDVTFLPVIPNPNLIVCVGLNYADHVQETGRDLSQQPTTPTLFLRTPYSQVGHEQSIVLPPESSALDFEGEIAIVIGRGGRRIPVDQAWAHVAGYTCYNDASIRDWQMATPQWTTGKNFWKTGAMGPWLVTADEIAPGEKLTLVTRLNGVEMQRSDTDLLIHQIPALIAHISTFTPIGAGDIIVTGTPGGVGFKRNPPIYMKAGDIVEVDVDRIGVLKNSIQSETTA